MFNARENRYRPSTTLRLYLPLPLFLITSMNLLDYPVLQPQPNKTAADLSPSQSTPTDVLTLTYYPHFKLLNAKWQTNVAIAQIRDAVRMLARAIAILKAELILIEMPLHFAMTESDKQWASRFLQYMLQHTSMQRVARVVPASQNTAMRQVANLTAQMPYETANFNEREEALQWLLQDRYSELKDHTVIRVPLNFNLKLVRTGLQALPHPATQPAQSEQQPALPAPIPDEISINTPFVTMRLNKEKRFMTIRWTAAPQSRQYRYGMLKAGRALVEHRLERLLLNNQRMGVLTLADQGWLISLAQKMLPASSLSKVAVVTSADALQQMSSETIGQKLRDASLYHQTRYFLNEEEALDWLWQD